MEKFIYCLSYFINKRERKKGIIKKINCMQVLFDIIFILFIVNCDNMYIKVICFEVCDLLGSIFMIVFKVVLFFLVGGGKCIIEGVKGIKLWVFISLKFKVVC